MSSTLTQLCTFHVDDLLFAIEVVRIQEVIRFEQITQVPLSSPMVRGLINLRGQIVTAVDLRSRLDLETATDDAPMNVVIRLEEGLISIIVDDIGDVLEVDESAFEHAPPTLPAHLRRVVDAVCKLPDRLLLVLDPERAASVDEAPA
ncbi:MAG: chemotaxis protein CheW [Myxococcota bacterium]